VYQLAEIGRVGSMKGRELSDYRAARWRWVRVTTRRGYDWSRPFPRTIDQAHRAPLPFKPAARSDTRKRSASVGSL
jgi:hypothetical protein